MVGAGISITEMETNCAARGALSSSGLTWRLFTALFVTIVVAVAVFLAVPGTAHATDVSSDSQIRALAQTEGESVTVTLQSDITLSTYWELAKNTKVTLDLNGHTLSRGLNGEADFRRWGLSIYMYQDAQLTIKDSVGTGKITGGSSSNSSGAIYGKKGNRIYMYGGSICNNYCDEGAVYLGSGTKMYMYGGSITDNTGHRTSGWGLGCGAGVYADEDSQFYLYGGTISNNTSVWEGGGIYAYYANVYIYGGAISNNRSYGHGGGIYFYDGSKAQHEFIIAGGTISENKGNYNGGGIYASHLTMTGGTISGNSSSELGGGIYLCEEGVTSYIKGGTITSNTANVSGSAIYALGNLTISQLTATQNICGDTARSGGYLDGRGAVVGNHITLNGTGLIIVDDNTGGDMSRRMYFYTNDSKFLVRVNLYYEGSPITCYNLVEGSRIGLTSECYSGSSRNGHPEIVNLANPDLAKYFHATAAGYVSADATYLKLESSYHIYANPGASSSVVVTGVTVSKDGTSQNLTTYGTTGYVAASGTWSASDRTNMTVAITYSHDGAIVTRTETGVDLSGTKTFGINLENDDVLYTSVAVSLAAPSSTVDLNVTSYDSSGGTTVTTASGQGVGSTYQLSTAEQYVEDNVTYVLSGWRTSTTSATAEDGTAITTSGVTTADGMRSETWTVAGTDGQTLYVYPVYVSQAKTATNVTVSGIAAPTAGTEFTSTATVAYTASDSSTLGTQDSVSVSWGTSDSVADYNTAYTATIEIAAPTDVVFDEQSNLAVALEGASEVAVVRTSSSTATITATYPATAKAKVTAVTVPSDVTAAYGAAFSELGLPDTVKVTVQSVTGDSGTETINVPVTWISGGFKGTVSSTDYIQGRVEISNAYDVTGDIEPAWDDSDGNLMIQVGYTVGAAPAVAVPMSSLAEGTYSSAQTVKLSCYTEGASIQYSLDGSTWNSYDATAGVVLEGVAGTSTTYSLQAKAVGSDGSESSSVTFEYIIDRSATSETKTISSFIADGSIEFDWGTALADMDLPSTTTVTYSDDTTGEVGIAWDLSSANPSYDPNASTSQTFTLTGALDLPSGVTLAEGVDSAVNAQITVAVPVTATNYTVYYGFQTTDGTDYDFDYFASATGASSFVGNTISIDTLSPLSSDEDYDADTLGFYSQAVKVTYKANSSSTALEVVDEVTDSNTQILADDVVATADGAQIYLYFNRKSFDLNFDLNLPSTVSSEATIPETPTTQELLYGASVTKPTDPELLGYAFAGWYTTADCSGEPVNLSSYTMPSENVTLYAKWVQNDGAYINFWGGSLRLDKYATSSESGSTTYTYDAADLRLGFNFVVPEGATDVKFGWYYGTSEAQVASESDRIILEGKNSRKAGSLTTDPSGISGTVANIVFTGVPSAHYGDAIYAQMYVTYTLNGVETTITSDTVHRSVFNVASAIQANTSASTTEKNYANGIIDASSVTS